MLNRFAGISPEGKYLKGSKESLALQRVALIGARSSIVSQSATTLQMALTIAIRFGAVRRQFGTEEIESQILDYQTHKFRLFPSLASAFAMHFTGRKIDDRYRQLLFELKDKNTKNLNDIHSISAGLKAFCSWTTRDAVIICRDCCGGHGYSSYNRLGRIIKDFQVQTTWDGDNTVLAQQTARYLMRTLARVFQGKNVEGSAKYLERTSDLLQSRFQVQTEDDLANPTNLILALEYRSANLCFDIAKRFETLESTGMDQNAIWNKCFTLAKCHCELYQAQVFSEVVESQRGTRIYSVLKHLFDLYVLFLIESDMGHFRHNDFVSSEQALLVHSRVRTLCDLLRPDAVLLVDSFDIPDIVLDSQIGKRDGNLYKNYFERVQRAPTSKSVPTYWEKLIKPLVHRQ